MKAYFRHYNSDKFYLQMQLLPTRTNPEEIAFTIEKRYKK